MLTAGDEFLQTQRGNNNPYNQDNETTWLDWSRQSDHADHLRFVKKMIAFRKAHPTLGRSRFWRDDVRWYGVGGSTDLSHDSHSLAYCLRGASQGDCDIYVMINAYHEPLTFEIQESPSVAGSGRSTRPSRARMTSPTPAGKSQSSRSSIASVRARSRSWLEVPLCRDDLLARGPRASRSSTGAVHT